MEARSGGDRERYRAGRGPGRRRVDTADEEYVVRVAFDGDWTRYRACRDRLREELGRVVEAAVEHRAPPWTPRGRVIPPSSVARPLSRCRPRAGSGDVPQSRREGATSS